MQRFLSATATLLVVLAVPVYSIAGDRPFSAEVSGVQGFTSSGSHVGISEIMHLGRSLVFLTIVDDPFNPENTEIASVIFRPADDDAVTGQFDLEFDAATGLYFGTLTFIRGSGRFLDVSGQADVVVYLSPDAAEFELLVDGTIDY